MKGSIVYYTENQGDLYRLAGLLKVNGIQVAASPDEHPAEDLQPARWIANTEIKKLQCVERTRWKLSHENANAISYDLDNKACYFEHLGHRSWAEDFEGDEFVYPIFSAKSPLHFLELIKSKA